MLNTLAFPGHRVCRPAQKQDANLAKLAHRHARVLVSSI